MKTCECGCGLDVGAGRRFRQHHHLSRLHESLRGKRSERQSNGPYMLRYGPGHPKADRLGYVREHVLIAESALGRILPDKARVHHINGDGHDNRTKNLVICEDDAYHMFIHQRHRALQACGNSRWRRCSFCGRYDDPAAMWTNTSSARHRECGAEYMRQFKARKQS